MKNILNQQGYNYLRSIFNGFQELELRNDAGKELVRLYKKLYPDEVKRFSNPIERGKFVFQFIYLESILSRPQILKTLDTNDKIALLDKGIENFEEISNLSKSFGTFGLVTPVWVLGRLLDVSRFQDFQDKKI